MHAADSIPKPRRDSIRVAAHVLLRCARGLAFGGTLLSATVGASSFQIDQLYSNADGSVQYVVLRDLSGNGGALAGDTLVSTHDPLIGSKTFTFAANLPVGSTQGKSVLVATSGFVALGIVAPDYVIPARFLPTDGGTLVFNDPATTSSVTFASLPIDGTNAYFANGTTAQNVATNFAGASAPVPASTVGVVEYYNFALDHYFMSPLAPDIDALDSGRIAGWTRTGYVFKAYPPTLHAIPPPVPVATVPVCRFYIPPQHGDSHFFSASIAECHDVLMKTLFDPNYSGYVYETPEAFDIVFPDTTTGACPAGTVPVYRLWNQRADSNHRYVSDPTVKGQMVARGYLPEGYGPDGVAMCSPGAVLSDARVRVTNLSPFAAGCDSAPLTGSLFTNAEVEPMLAVDPANPDHLIGVWQQDRWSNGGSRGLRTGVSFDGGRSWTQAQAALSRCTGGNAGNGGDYARASDPWVTIGAGGTAYQSSISFTGGVMAAGSTSSILVARSTDGGLNWASPVTIQLDGAVAFNDKEAITADPSDARYAYVTWDRLDSNSHGSTWIERTSTSGASWEAAHPIYDPGPNNQTLNNQISVLPDGSLALFFSEFDTIGNTERVSVRVLRSGDHGGSWSAPIEIAQTFAVGTHDPETGRSIRDGADLGAIAAGRNGTLAAVWQDARFSGGAYDGIALSRSTDGGVTWSAPVQVNRVPAVQAFLPTVSIRDDGTIGVLYYDMRNNTPSLSTLPIDIWLAETTDGVNWMETHVSGPFDLDNAPLAIDTAGSGLFVGDYQALASAGTTFLPFYVQTNPGIANVTDVFASIVTAAGFADNAKRAVPEGRMYRSAPAVPFAPTADVAKRVSNQAQRTLAHRAMAGHPLPQTEPDSPIP